jgi:8-oxo-dGTP diphosphatase
VIEFDEYFAALPSKRMGAGMLFTDGLGRVLLVEPVYKTQWEIPGGTVESGESPHAAAIREVREELSLTVAPGRLLVTDWVPSRSTRPDVLMFIFDGGVLSAAQTAQIRLPADELRAWAWVPIEGLGERLSPLLTRRVRAAADAHVHGTTGYLEFGTWIV